ncbi:unnamed protein product [Meloidogyne enterolobii]|uniref:Uncharacterized protein n=2 Tax=Meloidogyne enterolobii TaxID=390850 RepID=A0ACB1AAZ0_MELEN|nr:unnamed protein product [Meloidogyne enterolobii]
MLDIVKRLIDGNVENMSEQLSVVQNAAAALYETFMPNKLNYEATTINEEKLNNQTFLNQILYNLLKGVEEGSEVDNETMATAIAIWEYFIFKFEIPSNTECNSDMNTSGKKKHAYSFNKKQSQNRHKRAPCDCPPETLIEICMNIVFFVLLMMVFLPKVHIDYYLP